VRFLTRFQRLERARAAPTPARSPNGERFEAIESAAPLPEVQSASLERFAPPVTPPLELQPRSDAQPFVRCPVCGLDSAPGTRRCPCGTALDTLESVSFNAELWDRHRLEQARHETEQQRHRAADLEAAQAQMQERQALGEAIAREVAARERGRGTGSGLAGALLLVGLLAVVLLPRGPLARLVFVLFLGVVAARSVVVARRRSRRTRPEDESSVTH
jgi:hypothetical protein